MKAAGIEIDEHDNGQPYKPEDIIILSDGLCSSACALFMELMHHEAGVRTVVIGGQPSYGPMQAPSGNRGAAIYKAENMHRDIELARDIDKSRHVDLPNRASAFLITTATVNLRDQVRHTDTSATPLQFLYEAADCRIFLIPETWYNYTNLWKYAADAIWQKPALCAEGSRMDHIQPTHPSLPGKPYNASSTLSGLADSQSDGHPSSTQDRSHFILDDYESVDTMEGIPCQGDNDCPAFGSASSCQTVDVCRAYLRIKSNVPQPYGKYGPQKQCVIPCKSDPTICSPMRPCTVNRDQEKPNCCAPLQENSCDALPITYHRIDNSICYGTKDTLTCYKPQGWIELNVMVNMHPQPYSQQSIIRYVDGKSTCSCGNKPSVCDRSKPQLCPKTDGRVCVCTGTPQKSQVNKLNS
ncbi:hypothetical protein AFCA_006264 [Aspergillus flavus]|uniref:Uncharacterized protein n=1 Tax=Aspergillus flavus TaxID=5059 RepID=A0AB74BY88_ASPFL|nr:hypothetical protein CA14_003539 [Aspergillus flavus]UDD58841.1 hypothetical protein AFCA_006264 [Aspergillus flavus]